MLPPRATPALGLLLTLVACGGSTDQDDAGAANLAAAGSAGSSADTGGSAAAGASGTTANGGSSDDGAAPVGRPCDDHGGGSCGPTAYCSYGKADGCGVGGTCVPRPEGCITIADPKQPCMCDGSRAADTCAGKLLHGVSPAPFASACHPGGGPVVCSSEDASGPGCGTREYCDTAGAAGSSTTGVCRPLPAP